MLRRNPYFTGCLRIQFFNSSYPLHSQLGQLWLPTTHCAAPMLLTERHAMPVCHQVLPTHPVIPHPPVDHGQVFRPILYFHPSPVQSYSRLAPATLFYLERYGFERAFSALRRFFTLHSLYQGKQRIFLGVIGILSMYLRLHA